jgi:hypothetical protein
MKRFAIIAALTLFSTGACQAAEMSPWFGGEDQSSFQIDTQTKAIAVASNDALETSSTEAASICDPKGCIIAPKSVETVSAASVTP